MRRLLLTLALILLPSFAFAQCNGVFPVGTVCGNFTASPALPKASSISSLGNLSIVIGGTGILGGTPNSVLYDNGGIVGEVLPLTVPQGGTGAVSFTAGLPLVGNGVGAIGQGTKSGNTTKFATTTGTLNNGNCIGIDSSGNFVDEGGPCTVGGGGGTVTAGTANQIAYYPASAATVAGSPLSIDAVTNTISLAGQSLIPGVVVAPGSLSIYMGIGGAGSLALATDTKNTGFGYGALSQLTGSGADSGNSAFGYLALADLTTGKNNTGIGDGTLLHATTASNSTALGLHAALNTNGSSNIAIGHNAMAAPTAGTPATLNNNIAIGEQAMFSAAGSPTGDHNIAIGDSTLISLTSGTNNIALGPGGALSSLTSGASNIAIGHVALANVVTGSENTAVGEFSSAFVLGSDNTAIGFHSGKGAVGSTGSNNVAVGANALEIYAAGSNNVAVGNNAGNQIAAGNGNVAIGDNAFAQGDGTQNISLGGFSLLTNAGNNNVAVGYFAGGLNAAGSGNVFIGFNAAKNETGSNKLYIANTDTTTPLIGGDFSAKTLTFNGTPEIAALAFGSLPTPTAGQMAYINDAAGANCGDGTCTTWGTTVTGGGGAIKLFVWFNGTNWTLIGK